MQIHFILTDEESFIKITDEEAFIKITDEEAYIRRVTKQHTNHENEEPNADAK